MPNDTEYLTSNRRIRYPFEDNAVLTRGESPLDDSLALSVFGCFVDASIHYKSQFGNHVPVVTGIGISGNTLSFRLEDDINPAAEGSVVLVTRSTGRFITVRGENEWCWYVFVLSYDGIREFSEAAEKIGTISMNRVLVNTRCLSRTATMVNTILVYGGEGRNESGSRYTRDEAVMLDPDVILTDTFSIRPGYNMKFEEELNMDGFSATNGFSLNAIAGAGAGLAPCGCQKSDTEFKMPGLLSKDGHSRIFNDTCYDIVPYVTSESEGFLKINVKCKACCTCEMYEKIVNEKLIPLRDKILADRESLQSTLDTYETNVAKWNERIATALPEDISVSYTNSALDAAGTDVKSSSVVGKMSRCGFSIMMRNDSFVDIIANLDTFMANGDTFESQVSYMDADNNPVVQNVDLQKVRSEEEKKIPLFSITLPPGRSAVLTYFLRLPSMTMTDKQTGFLTRANMSFYQGTRLIDRRIQEISI